LAASFIAASNLPRSGNWKRSSAWSTSKSASARCSFYGTQQMFTFVLLCRNDS
jgi:hypothetical protein